jgi:very-short-patch-repair endonuclease
MPGELKELSRQLRNNMTDAERRLWSRIRMRQLGGYRFYRQKVIGDRIADFYCHRAGLVIEVDGSQHYSLEGTEADGQRDQYLQGCGMTVLRFTNIDVLQNIEGVVDTIAARLGVE